MSGRRASNSIAAAAKPRWSLPREREATRLAILDVARRLIELHGEAALSLSDVANAAGLPRSTIYGYFTSKRHLLGLLNEERLPEAEPAAALSYLEEEPVLQRTQRKSGGVRSPRPSCRVNENPRPGCTIEKNTEAFTSPTTPPSSVSSYDELMQRQAKELDRLAKRIIVPRR